MLDNLVAFFMSSTKDMLNQECAMLAERWHWTHEQVRALPTGQRREYLEIVNDLYQREHDALEKAKRK